MNYLKAVVGAVAAGAAAAGSALNDGSITGTEWLTIAVALLVGFGSVYGVKPGPGLTTAKPPPKPVE